ncbi:hypothetical protein SPKIRA_02510 [Sphingomonas paucimobilis]|uniref:DNA, contig: SP614 n=1 Tax=Sphingomonas paucimobilis NBRC 13935 TaxID=1219050 RepID=A0A0C9MR54_SPHPI|nr:hypothetical protein BRX36_15395 [Sphingomonas sp. S-NIH.Pt1_0416]BCI69421.1 hypothetical protein SPKIRA_02510 [Sphingomonas paucimobilis]GAN13226.1 hypothetical protein SP6_14_03860 [Sphingomonas paucimobilis NBRC 13935]
MLFDDQLVLRIDRDLGVLADAELGMGRHRMPVGIGDLDAAVLDGLDELFPCPKGHVPLEIR